MGGSVVLPGWPEVDMDLTWRGRVEGTAAGTPPGDGVLLVHTDISVRLGQEEGRREGQSEREGQNIAVSQPWYSADIFLWSMTYSGRGDFGSPNT